MGRLKVRPPKNVLAPQLKLHTYQQVAKGYKVNPATVGKWAKLYNIRRTKRGEAHHNAKLQEADIYTIRKCKGEIFGHILAKKYGVSDITILDIWEYRTWWWLPDEEPNERNKTI